VEKEEKKNYGVKTNGKKKKKKCIRAAIQVARPATP
jgi:hypothetical protein